VKSQDAQAMKRVGEQHPDFRVPSYSLAGLMMLTTEPAEAERLVDEVFSTGKEPAFDKFITGYLTTQVDLTVAAGVTAQLPISRDAVGLALAELRQDHDDLAGAIEVVEQLEPTTYAAGHAGNLERRNPRRDALTDEGVPERVGRPVVEPCRLEGGLPLVTSPRRPGAIQP
jgi:hypothetical protein